MIFHSIGDIAFNEEQIAAIDFSGYKPLYVGQESHEPIIRVMLTGRHILCFEGHDAHSFKFWWDDSIAEVKREKDANRS